MRLLDHDEPIDPEIAATLDAIDATLAGEPVDARYAELAEIALLLSSDRPQVPREFARTMDERVARRFAGAPPGAERRRRWPSAGFWEASGALMAGVALIVGIVVVVSSVHGGFSSGESSSSASAGVSGTSSVASAAASSAPAVRAPNAARSSAGSPSTTLKIDSVAQQVYDVVGELNGIVESSTVTQTGGPDGSADFQLSVPSGSLALAMTRLSSLQYAQVTSSTNNTQDITDQYNGTTRALADARALRTSLLQQLANAVTTEQVDSIKAQINDAEASISSDLATLNRLNHQVNFSQLEVTINARVVANPVSQGSGGFGLGRAAHDAGRVLTVAAGVALIAIAALTPAGLLVALVWWVGAALRRRRREQALDSV
jgi:hypothetical protein